MATVFRDSDTYRKKLMRISAAMRRYHEFHLKTEQNFSALSTEVDALEELSLSAFSLMKAIKSNLVEAAKRPAACIISPYGSWPDGDEDDR